MIVTHNDDKRVVIFKELGDYKPIKKIPKGNWTINFNSNNEPYLLEGNDFKLPEKIYGNVSTMTEKYMNTWNHLGGNMGVAFIGLKGSGKSVQAKHICINSDLPVLVIDRYISGLNSFLYTITQKVIIFLDEFEKIFSDDNDAQIEFLQLMDGGFDSNKLFVITSNDKRKLNNYLLNRPGRIRYLKEYDGITPDIIETISDDKLINPKAHKPLVKALCTIIGEVSIDLLTSIINEFNIYPDITVSGVLDEMNVSPSENCSYKFKVYAINSKGKISENEIGTGIINRNPLMMNNVDYSSDFLYLDEVNHDNPYLELLLKLAEIPNDENFKDDNIYLSHKESIILSEFFNATINTRIKTNMFAYERNKLINEIPKELIKSDNPHIRELRNAFYINDKSYLTFSNEIEPIIDDQSDTIIILSIDNSKMVVFEKDVPAKANSFNYTGNSGDKSTLEEHLSKLEISKTPDKITDITRNYDFSKLDMFRNRMS